jgi:hypothetical protein
MPHVVIGNGRVRSRSKFFGAGREARWRSLTRTGTGGPIGPSSLSLRSAFSSLGEISSLGRKEKNAIAGPLFGWKS